MTEQKVLQEFVSIKKLRSFVDQYLQNEFLEKSETLKVLEAGCGSLSYISADKKYNLDGIDISQKQLDRNKGLNHKILGDIQTYRFPASDYKLILCFWVLEHVHFPTSALKNLAEALDEKGILVIGVPNVMSLKGLFTKLTPHWFHIFVYRHIYNFKLAGIDDNPPFETTIRFAIAPHAVKAFAKEHQLSVLYFDAFEDFRQEELRGKLKISEVFLNIVDSVVKVLTLGTIQVRATSYVMVLQKNAPASVLQHPELAAS